MNFQPRQPRLARLTTGSLALVSVLFLAARAEATPRPAVVELFTSEGCSSCPPAEAYVGELANRSDVLALAFHVDYWDDLGWRDRFELSEASARQRQYGQALRLRSVYTPQVILDGRADYIGSNRSAIGKVLQESRDGVPVMLSVGDSEIHVKLESSELGRGAEVTLVSYLRKAVSSIGRGENAGRTLEEYNIVRSLRSLGRWDGASRDFSAPLSSLPRDATDVAVLVQASGQGAIVGAATRPLH